jgi:outer membrane murein-binding lipoprotein Lpp
MKTNQLSSFLFLAAIALGLLCNMMLAGCADSQDVEHVASDNSEWFERDSHNEKIYIV